MIGNSSSGLLEAPSFKLPVINVGDRQKERFKSGNIIDVSGLCVDEINLSIKQATSVKFKNKIKNIKNPYGDGNASVKIIKKLKTVKIDKTLLTKNSYFIKLNIFPIKRFICNKTF